MWTLPSPFMEHDHSGNCRKLPSEQVKLTLVSSYNLDVVSLQFHSIWRPQTTQVFFVRDLVSLVIIF
jgi:hypothetical protein